MSSTIAYPFPVTIPAGTSQANPLITLTQFESNEVERIEWDFPAGCNGVVGIQLGARGASVLPAIPGRWFTTSGNTGGIGVEGMHTTGDWSVIAYNTGAHPHTVQVTFIARRIEKQLPEPVPWTDAELSYYGPPYSVT